MTAKQILSLTEQLTEIVRGDNNISISNKEGKHKVIFNIIKNDNVCNLFVTGDYGKHIYGFYEDDITFEKIAALDPKIINDKCEASMTGARPTEWRADIAFLACKDILKNDKDKMDEFIKLGGPDALKLPTTWAKWLRCPKGTDIKVIGETEICKLDDEINFSLFFDTKTDLDIFFKFNTTSYRTEIHTLALRIALGFDIDDIPILKYSKYESEFLKLVKEKNKKQIEEASKKSIIVDTDIIE